MQLRYEIDEGEFMAAYEVLWRSRRMGSTSNLLLGLVMMGGGLAYASFKSWLGYLLAGVGALLVAMVLLRKSLHRKAFRDNPKFTGPISAFFGEEEIRVESAVGESRLDWSIYTQVLESDDYFLAMMSKWAFSIIPKRAFESAEDIGRFRDLLSRKLGSVVLA